MKLPPTSKLRKKSHWSARLVVTLIGASMAGSGWLLVHRGVDVYPTKDRYGAPTFAYSRAWIYFGIFFIVAALVPWEKIFRDLGNTRNR